MSLYATTSMYPGQRLFIFYNMPPVQTTNEIHVSNILEVASRIVDEGEMFDARFVVFPLFMAGCATLKPEAKRMAVELIRRLEPHGIAHNTRRTRQLLVAVCEEQSKRAREGRRAEEVEWLALARERGLNVVNCGI